MKNKKGFTLVELLAVIVVLGIIIVLVSRTVINNINESKKSVKFLAAKEISEMATAYMEVESDFSIADEKCVQVTKMLENDYLDYSTINPETGEAVKDGEFDNHYVCFIEDSVEQKGYDLNTYDELNYYVFNQYAYCIGGTCDSSIISTVETGEDIFEEELEEEELE